MKNEFRNFLSPLTGEPARSGWPGTNGRQGKKMRIAREIRNKIQIVAAAMTILFAFGTAAHANIRVSAFLRQFWQPIGRFGQRIAHSDDNERQSAQCYDFQRFCIRCPVFIFRACFARQFESWPEPDWLRDVQAVCCTSLFRRAGIQAGERFDDFGCPERNRHCQTSTSAGRAHNFIAAGEREDHRGTNGNI